MHSALIVLTTLWLVLDQRGMSEPELFCSAWPSAVFEEGRQLQLLGASGPCGAAVVHKAREGPYIHGFLLPAARRGELRVQAGEALHHAVIGNGPAGSGDPRGVPESGTSTAPSQALLLAPGGAVMRSGVELLPWPPPEAGGAWKVVHACPVREEQRCEWRAAGGGLRVRMFVSQCPDWPAAAGAVPPRAEVSVHLLAEREVVLTEGAGIEVRGGAWPFAAASVQATRTSSGWMTAEQPATVNSWPLRLGTRLQIGPSSEHGLWLGAAWRASIEDQAFRLLLLAPGTTLAAGEARVLRLHLSAGDHCGPAAALVLQRAPLEATTALEAVTHRFAERLLDDPIGGLQRFNEDAGDWMHAQGVAGNLEYDSVDGLWAHALRRGSARAASACSGMLDHLLSVDRQPDRGFFHEHGRGHRTGRFEAGHHWVAGMLRLCAARRDPLWLELAAEVLDAQRRELSTIVPRKELPRSMGWGLQAAVDAARAAAPDAQHLRVVRNWRTLLMASRRPSGLLLLQDAEAPSTAAVMDVFVLGGVVLPALVDSCAVLPDADLRQRLKAMGRALWNCSIRRNEKEEMVLAESVPLESGSGAPGRGCGQLLAAKAALALAGMLAADASLLQDARIAALERGIEKELREAPPRYCGMTTALLLRAQNLRARQPSR